MFNSLTELCNATTIHNIEHPAAPDLAAVARELRLVSARRNLAALRADAHADSVDVNYAVRELVRAEHAAGILGGA